eukprot:Mrub_05989.p1 GENE.Mrub_05989~~Mrub_05989.p1  ORF type:complete len:351 (-),score=53.33 Mrub_05989:10-954(-)
MKKSYDYIKNSYSKIDITIEIRDIRAPLSSCNTKLNQYFLNKKKIILLNKIDLVNKPTAFKSLKILSNFYSSKHNVSFENQNNPDVQLSTLYNENITIMPLSAKKCSPNIKSLISSIKSMYISPYPATIGTNVLVYGLPNVGKSTFINACRQFSKFNLISTNDKKLYKKTFRYSKLAKTEDRPCVTRHVSRIAIHLNPLINMYDTPGVADSDNSDSSVVLKQMLLNIIDNREIELGMGVDYALWLLNTSYNFDYVKYYGLDKPSLSAEELWYGVMLKSRYRGMDCEQFYSQFLKGFRESEFSYNILLDSQGVDQ